MWDGKLKTVCVEMNQKRIITTSIDSTWYAFAFIIVDQINAAQVVLAGSGCAIIYVPLAVHPGETFNTKEKEKTTT